MGSELVPYCTKVLSVSDTKCRLAWPTTRLARLLDLNGGHRLDFWAVDENGVRWRFRRSWRKGGVYLKPVVSGDWLRFVRSKDLRPGDEVWFYENSEFPKVVFTIKIVKRMLVTCACA